MTRHAAPRRGFTLVEILVVIGIIAILAGILVVAIPKVVRSSKNAGTAADIAQIGNAIGTFKSKMNAAYIPSGGGGTKGTFRLCTSYLDNSTPPQPLNWPEVVYLKQVFPQMNLADNGLRVGGAVVANGVATAPTGSVPLLQLDANQTLVFFLTGGPPTGMQGFSTDRTKPFTPVSTANPNESRLGPFLDFPANRYAAGAAAVTARHASDNASQNGDGAASLMDRWGAPYAYFAYNPGTNGYMSTSFEYRGRPAVTAYIDSTSKPFNPKGFQIISAGDNGLDDALPYGFGPGGSAWTPGGGEYAEDSNGGDDLSNFNGGMLINKN